MSNVPSGKTDYDAFGKAFARTRKGMGWQEVDLFCERLKIRNPKPNVLDVGCGSGRLLEQLSVHFSDFRYVGTDSSRVLVNVASKDFPNRTFALADMREVTNHPKVRADAPFDAVFAVASFHHLLTVSDRVAALKEFSSVLAP
ncbi:MAG: class I SAM-dependent methyltransferase [Patescibacteria group bacterium]